MKRDRSLFVSPLKIIKIISKYDSQYLLWSFLFIIVSAMLPLMFVYGPKTIMDTILFNDSYKKTLITVVLFGFSLLILNILKSFFQTKQTLSSSRFSYKMQYDFCKKIMALDLYKLEEPQTLNTIQLASDISSITNTVSCVGNILSGVITIIGLSYAIAKLDIGCVISVIVVVVLKTLISWLQLKHQKKVREKYADNNRIGNYLDGVAYFSPGGAKEIRVNNGQTWFISKISDFRKRMVALQCKDFAYGTRIEVLLTFITTVQTFFVLVFTATRTVNGLLSLSEFTMVFSATLTLTSAFASFGEQINNYRSQVLPVSDYDNLFNYDQPNCVDIASDENVPTKEKEIEIVFDHVSFSYDQSKDFVLKDICLRIKNKEKLVIVGLNGSGKSTLIKLLCKFYKPTKGKISINGTDIWEINNNEYYKYIAAVFQDYSNFAFSIFENVAMHEKASKNYVKQILQDVGLTKYADVPETIIYKVFSDQGIELSGGEGQKLSIARAVYKNANILILDEPTSSLDVRAEFEIYNNFYKIARDKTTIFVSHRLACSTIADNIAVFSKGEMVEYGSHDSLINKNGLYAEMYQKQRSAYWGTNK